MGRYEGVPSKFLTPTGIDPEAVRKVRSLRVFEEEGEEDECSPRGRGETAGFPIENVGNDRGGGLRE